MGDIGDSSEEDPSSIDPSTTGGTTGPGGSTTNTDPDAPPPPFAPSEPVLARLTQPQYANVVRDLFGAGVVSHPLEADSRPYLFSVIGGATNAVSELGVDLYSRAAYDITSTAFADAAKRKALAPCSTTTPLTDACLTTFVRDFGLRAWRRPLDTEEQGIYHKLGTQLGTRRSAAHPALCGRGDAAIAQLPLSRRAGRAGSRARRMAALHRVRDGLPAVVPSAQHWSRRRDVGRCCRAESSSPRTAS